MKAMYSHLTQCFMLLAVCTTVCNCVGQSNTSSMSVANRRPVAEAIQKLETIYMVPITYEDIRYLNESETTIDAKGHIAPKAGAFSFSYEAPAPDAPIETRKELAFAAVKNLLQSYNTERGANFFTVNPTNTGLDVTPVESTDARGEIEELHPLLDTPVSIPPGQRTAAELIGEIAQQISAATGRVTDAGTLPMPLFSQHLTNITAENESARSVLERLFNEIPLGYTSKPNANGGVHIVPGASLSWRVLCGPEKNPECSINIQTVTPKGRNAAGLEGVPSKAIRPEDQ